MSSSRSACTIPTICASCVASSTNCSGSSPPKRAATPTAQQLRCRLYPFWMRLEHASPCHELVSSKGILMMSIAQPMFWSGETLSERLPDLIDPFVPDQVDCAAYTLSVGPEVYVSPNDQTPDSTTVTVSKLSRGDAFTVPPGQFAFLLTEEIVSVPTNALAFISIRAKVKFRGLVNVSGFHVDPGYRGQLTFAVFNAGPAPIHLKRGQRIFLIWYASLDRETSFKKEGKLHTGIDTELINGIAGELQSLTGLSKKIETVDKALRDRMHAIEKSQVRHKVIAGIALLVIVSLVGSLVLPWVKNAVESRVSIRPASTEFAPQADP